MIVVSDTSPVLNLARIGHLEFLAQLYGEALIPPAVYEELNASTDFILPAWLTVAIPTDREQVQTLCADLDPGEAEAIVLAMEQQAISCSSTKGEGVG